MYIVQGFSFKINIIQISGIELECLKYSTIIDWQHFKCCILLLVFTSGTGQVHSFMVKKDLSWFLFYSV